MHRIRKFILVLLSPGLACLYAVGYAQEIDFMTYNIRFDNPDDGENRWDKRKENLVQLIRRYDPDIIGTQEGLLHQVKFMDSALIDHDCIGQGRDDGKNKGEFCALYYKKSALNLLMQGVFWLSETPEIPSRGWDAAYPRLCTYGLFEHRKTRQRFWIFNTHLDHMGTIAREKSAALIVARITALNREQWPVVLMGDFNLEPGSAALNPVIERFNDSRSACPGEIAGPAGTFNAFRFDLPVVERIDYIFISKGKSEVLKYTVISDSDEGLYPSDHFPVFVTVKIKQGQS